MATNTAKATVTLRDLTHVFASTLAAAQPFWPSICHEHNSTGADEKYGWLGSFPGVREFLGERKFNQLRAATYELRNKHWENSLMIDRTDIDDDRLGMYGVPMSELALEAAYHPDELLFDVLIAGESAACFDGQYFYDTDHSWGDSGTQSNDLTYDASSHTAVTAAEFKAAYHQARRALLGFVNDRGKYMNARQIVRANQFQLLVPLELEEVAQTVVQADLLSTATTNIATNVVLDKPEIVATPRLSGTKFILNDMTGPYRPFVMQKRQPIKTQMKDQDDIEHKGVKFMTEARYNVGYFAWWKSVLTTFN